MEQKKSTVTLPEGWIWTTIPELFLIIGGGTPAKNNISFWNGNINWASVKDVKSKYLSETEDKITEFGVAYSNTNLAEEDDLVFVTRISPGQVSIVKKQTAINQDLKILKIFGGVSSSFVYYLLSSCKNQFISQSSGTTVKGLKINDLNEIKLPLPPLEEQHRIVARIEELFSELDHAEEALKKAQKQLEVYKQALLKSAFEGKLTMRWREEKVYLENGLPFGWEWKTLGEVSHINMGQSPPGNSYNLNGIGIPLINGPSEFNKSPFSKTKLEKWTTKPTRKCLQGDLILCVRGSTTGRQNFAGFDACIGRGVAAIHASEEITIKYIAYYTHSIERKILEMGTGSTFPNISKEQISNILIPMCTFDEQSLIVQEAEQKFTLVENLQKSIDSGFFKIKLIRQTILKKAFEGNLVLRNNEEEPASILLDRIQKEKALYISSQKLKQKEKPKSVKPMEPDKKEIKEILEKSMKPIPSEVLWQESIYYENIEAFYAELKKIEHEIEVIINGKESSIILKR